MAKKRNTRKKTKSNNQIFESEVLVYLYILVIITISIIGILKVGMVGEFVSNCIRYIFGKGEIVAFVIIILLSIYYALKKTLRELKLNYVFAFLIVFNAFIIIMTSLDVKDLSGMAVINDFTNNSSNIFKGITLANGGFIGALLYGGMSSLFDKVGTYIVLVVFILFAILLVMSKESRRNLKEKIIRVPGNIQEKREERKLKPKKVKESKKVQLIHYEEEETGEDFADLLDNAPNSNNSSINFIDADTEEKVNKPIEASLINSTNDEIIENKPEVKKSESVQSSVTPIYEDFMNYKLPPVSLLGLNKKSGKNSNTSYANDSGKKLVHILKEFGVETTLVETHIGPSVTKFELRPEVGVRVNKISNLQQDIKMGLAAKDIRIEAPIPGKNTVGIEVPNQEKTAVGIRDVIREIPDGKEDSKLLFALGKDLMGESVYGELNKMPHLLIAGATGSGKSVCVNSIITSILLRCNPSEVKLLLIDPKKVEFTPFHELPHLLGPVITDAEEANRALKVIVELMDKRYDTFSKLGVRNINSYNEYLRKHPEEKIKKMPWIVVIIDELADLMLVAAKEVESSIQRITQLARAAGIHLVVATQRPSVDVITGLIKSNIPSRISFAVSSAVDSRTILDQTGAEKLLGYGDMLYMPQGENASIRIQGCFVSDDEVKKIAQFCAKQAKPKYEDTFIRLDQVDRNNSAVTSSDPIYEDVKMFVIENGKASTSFIQRKFSIGYARAARLIDMLEEQGIIGPSNGSKPREVYVSSSTYNQEEDDENE